MVQNVIFGLTPEMRLAEIGSSWGADAMTGHKFLTLSMGSQETPFHS